MDAGPSVPYKEIEQLCKMLHIVFNAYAPARSLQDVINKLHKFYGFTL